MAAEDIKLGMADAASFAPQPVASYANQTPIL
jgi:hypothetical protein